MTDVISLTPAEQAHARARLGAIVRDLSEAGALRSQGWREAFGRTWRHPYVPRYVDSRDGHLLSGSMIDGSNPTQRAQWLDDVYSDATLVTEFTPDGVATSSSTLPGLLAVMLEPLDVADGQKVLDVGTGTGYLTALLCERLGSDQVTSVDINPVLVDVARERLAANGYHPTLAAHDGSLGYPPAAPFQRIIATCGVPAIPAAWVEQSTPGGVIVANVRGEIGSVLVRLTVDGNGTASGHVLPDYGSFMWLRHSPGPPPRTAEIPDGDNGAERSASVAADVLDDPAFAFYAQTRLPGVLRAFTFPDDDTADHGLLLYADDGSWAQVPYGNGRSMAVLQGGPRPLWDITESAHRTWRSLGEPAVDRFGLTVTAERQWTWLDQPDQVV